MSALDLTDMLAKLDAYEAWAMQRAVRGLEAAAQQATASMQANMQHGDVTGATRAGYVAYVVGPGRDGSAALAEAVAAVEGRNPGHSATHGGQLGPDSVGVVFTCPTDYQKYLETEQAGLRAVLGPTFDAFRGELTARAAKGA